MMAAANVMTIVTKIMTINRMLAMAITQLMMAKVKAGVMFLL